MFVVGDVQRDVQSRVEMAIGNKNLTLVSYHNFQTKQELAIHCSNWTDPRYMSVDIHICVADHNSWWMKNAKDQVWSKTVVTVAIVDQTVRSASAENNDYVKPLAFVPSNKFRTLFSEPKFISIDNIERHSETDVCFCKHDRVSLIVTFVYPDVIPHFTN